MRHGIGSAQSAFLIFAEEFARATRLSAKFRCPRAEFDEHIRILAEPVCTASRFSGKFATWRAMNVVLGCFAMKRLRCSGNVCFAWKTDPLKLHEGFRISSPYRSFFPSVSVKKASASVE
jgi:hypothetical protein